ncbi:predicted protein [Postia placenta Mad-698-R]|nr:predicted protein [Postia placenta Mad-698-R]
MSTETQDGRALKTCAKSRGWTTGSRKAASHVLDVQEWRVEDTNSSAGLSLATSVVGTLTSGASVLATVREASRTMIDADAIAHGVELPPDPDEGLEVQLDLKDPEVRDIGWNRDLAQLPPTAVNGLSNEDLFALIRCFHMVSNHLCEGDPILRVVSNSTSTSQKMNSAPRTRFVHALLTAIVGMAASGKHIARIRSWDEPLRTAFFCTVPCAGEIGSKDSLSGAPEAHKGETIEQEATNFVFGFASLAVGAATGQKEAPHVEQGGADGETVAEEKEQDEAAVGVDAALPDPTRQHGQAAIYVGALCEMFVKAGSFGLSFVLFGQPLISRGAHWLTHRFPNWREMLQLRASRNRGLGTGVPTNAQLALKLLRIAEESKTPLPPPTGGIIEESETVSRLQSVKTATWSLTHVELRCQRRGWEAEALTGQQARPRAQGHGHPCISVNEDTVLSVERIHVSARRSLSESRPSIRACGRARVVVEFATVVWAVCQETDDTSDGPQPYGMENVPSCVVD